MAEEKVCGIYKIENLVNNKKYIGLSNNIDARWRSHRNMLNRNDHFNIFLQRAWNKYGEENFKFDIIKECSPSELSKKEIYYIKLYQSNNDNFGYNLSSGGDNPTINEDSLLRKSLKYSKRVLQFTKEGIFIAEHQNGIFAAKIYNGENSAIYQNCTRKTKSAYGYVWRFKDDCDIESDNLEALCIENYERIYKSNPICQIDLEGNFIKEWKHCAEVGKYYNVVYENIRACCDKKYGRKTYIGYIWLYSEDYYKNGVDLSKHKEEKFTKSINQYDLEGNFINTYQSAREAERQTGIGYKMISRVCKGERPYTHGFIWKFALN